MERGAATLRARSNVLRALGGPRSSALRPIRAVRSEPAVDGLARSAGHASAVRVGGIGQGATRQNAAMER